MLIFDPTFCPHAHLKQEISLIETTPKELLIGISDSSALINKRILQDFQALYPDMKLLLVERDQYLLERMLEAGKLDMIFTMIPYEPHGTIVPKLFSTLYDGSDRPYFFHCNGKMPIWSFTLSLQKNFHLSEPEFQYIKLFIHYIDSLGLLTNTHTVDELLDFLRKGPRTSGSSRFS